MSNARTLADLVQDVAVVDGGKTAIIFQEHEISYAQLNQLIEITANALAKRGVGLGDRVCVMLPNIPHFVLAYYGVLRLGAVVVPINVLYKAEEIAYIANDSEACLVITHEAFQPQVMAAVAQAPSIREVIVVAGTKPTCDLTWWPAVPPVLDPTATPRTPVAISPDDLAVICYTSGTTGRSKGAMLTHRNFIANCEQIEAVKQMSSNADDRLLLVLPLFHIYAMNVGLNCVLRVGGALVLMVRFEAVPVLEAIQRYRCTLFLGAPPMYVAFVNLPELNNYDLSSIRVANSGAAALPAQILKQFKDISGVVIAEGYGLTETSPVSHSNSAGPVIKPGTVGPVIPGVEAKVVDEDGQEVPVGAEGEIVIRGENVMIGYWRNPEASEEALRGGWLHTGDVGTVDEDGYFTIVDRMKDMINAGGFKVWPREVEEVLYRHPAVREAAVVSMPDPYAGERPMAYVAVRDGQIVTAEELIVYCQQRLASFKAPTRVEFKPDLPKLPTGKILRRQLREEARTTEATSNAP
ncbi:MAG: AMP-dependent synthetase and ligase [Chloroflexi bacterium]|nr:AMP-dependent synthetase and ligase [Chloroflexota bacterium]